MPTTTGRWRQTANQLLAAVNCHIVHEKLMQIPLKFNIKKAIVPQDVAINDSSVVVVVEPDPVVALCRASQPG